MKSFAVLNLTIISAFLSLSSGTILAQSCNLPLPCQSVTTSDQNAFIITNNGTGRAGVFSVTDLTTTRPALEGRTNSTSSNAVGVHGQVITTNPGDHSAGVRGINNEMAGNPSSMRIGVWGTANASNASGVLGTSEAGKGVTALSQTGIALFAETTDPAGGIAVWGKSNTRALVGTVGGASCAGTYGVGGCADVGIGVFGNSNSRAVVGTLGGTSCAGSYAVGGCAGTTGDGVVGRGGSVSGRAGFFQGNVVVTGTLSKGSGAFKIDHPQDPKNKYLSHSFVESPDMLSLYTGNVVLDAQGAATVGLPDWFEALNREFRYQLTAIGAPAPSLYIAEEVSQHHFKIAGGQPGMKVSWQVTGIRHDPYAEQNRIPVEEWKSAAERGKYLHPAAYGQPAEMGVHFVQERPHAPADQLSEGDAQATASRLAQERGR